MKLELHRLVKHRVTIQGAPVVNHALIYRKGPRVVAIDVDMYSKYCDVMATGSNERNVPCLTIEANSRSMYLRKGKRRYDLTELSFPEYAGWTVWCCGIHRYTLAVCLIKG